MPIKKYVPVLLVFLLILVLTLLGGCNTTKNRPAPKRPKATMTPKTVSPMPAPSASKAPMKPSPAKPLTTTRPSPAGK